LAGVVDHKSLFRSRRGGGSVNSTAGCQRIEDLEERKQNTPSRPETSTEETSESTKYERSFSSDSRCSELSLEENVVGPFRYPSPDFRKKSPSCSPDSSYSDLPSISPMKSPVGEGEDSSLYLSKRTYGRPIPNLLKYYGPDTETKVNYLPGGNKENLPNSVGLELDGNPPSSTAHKRFKFIASAGELATTREVPRKFLESPTMEKVKNLKLIRNEEDRWAFERNQSLELVTTPIIKEPLPAVEKATLPTGKLIDNSLTSVFSSGTNVSKADSEKNMAKDKFHNVKMLDARKSDTTISNPVDAPTPLLNVKDYASSIKSPNISGECSCDDCLYVTKSHVTRMGQKQIRCKCHPCVLARLKQDGGTVFEVYP